MSSDVLSDFLHKNQDPKVLNDYLSLLAYSAQKTDSVHALVALRAENEELKEELLLEKQRYNVLLQEKMEPMEAVFQSEDQDVIDVLNSNIKNHILSQSAKEIKKPFIAGFSKVKSLFNN
ncbi:MAG: hypothetical protein Q9O24_06800 [Gammaproteobacteria bacterium]|nr:hypothetical protein [Gammaproteobacteria bacterium]